MTQPAPVAVTRVSIDGMLSVHAVRAVFTALGGLEGVQRADVALGSATVEHIQSLSPNALREAIEDCGLTVSGMSTSSRSLPTL